MWVIFFWSKTASVAYAQTYSDSGASTEDAFFFSEGNSLTVDGRKNLYGLTKAEWKYLLSSRKENGGSAYKNCTGGVMIGGTTCKGLFIFPDSYTRETGDMTQYKDFAAVEAAGTYSK